MKFILPLIILSTIISVEAQQDLDDALREILDEIRNSPQASQDQLMMERLRNSTGKEEVTIAFSDNTTIKISDVSFRKDPNTQAKCGLECIYYELRYTDHRGRQKTRRIEHHALGKRLVFKADDGNDYVIMGVNKEPLAARPLSQGGNREEPSFSPPIPPPARKEGCRKIRHWLTAQVSLDHLVKHSPPGCKRIARDAAHRCKMQRVEVCEMEIYCEEGNTFGFSPGISKILCPAHPHIGCGTIESCARDSAFDGVYDDIDNDNILSDIIPEPTGGGADK